MDIWDIENSDADRLRDHEPFRLLHRWAFLLAATLLFTARNAYAQSPTIDPTVNAVDTTPKDIKLGARFTIGGLYAFASGGVKSLPDILPIYGIRGGGLFPVGAQLDLTATGDFLLFPGWTYSIPAPSYGYGTTTEKVWTTEIPSSQLAALRLGVRLYDRTKISDPLFAAMSPRLQRLYWRKRVDRSGFYGGLSTGPVVGWHKRITRAVPENWPVNEPIPESAMEHSEQTYTRFYWAGSAEFGWSFNARIDLAVGFGGATRLQGDPGSDADEASIAYAQLMFTGSLSYILGRTGIKVP